MRNGLRLFLFAMLLATAGVVVWLLREPAAEQGASRRAEPAATAIDSAAPTGTAAPKPPLDVTRAVSLPGAWQQQALYVKPGHWTSLWLEAEAGRGDYVGTISSELQPEAGVSATLALWGRLESRRPITLSKREPRVVEQWVYAPNSYDPPLAPPVPAVADPRPNRRRLRTSSEESLLRGAQLRVALADGMFASYETRLPVTTLRHHQSLMVVLSAAPDAYRFWARLPLVLAPHDDGTLVPEQQAHFRLIVADDALRAPLPSLLQGWTTTGVVVWDRYDPARLGDARRQALLDWLHWGGRLVISGPESLELLRDSFLAPYLPAETVGIVDLDDAALRPLDRWTIEGNHAARGTPWRGVRLRPAGESRAVLGEGEGAVPLVVERRTGRGHVVVTAFRLTESTLVDWPSYDAFVHGCLLNRPERAWRRGRDDVALGSWADRRDWYDPRRTSEVAFASRDAVTSDAIREADSVDDASPLVGPGAAAWRDDDGLSLAARELLAEESGLTIPSVRFVLTMIGAYVVLLVPVNRFVFSRFGRPEWAWFAAPLIALGFTAYVIRAAELDIGFARSLSETAVVEMQPNYARAHATRWGALYNSLGHDYRFVGDDPSLAALPVGASGAAANAGAAKPYVREDAPEADGLPRAALAGWNVASNTTGLYRTEQIVDCGGPVRCTPLVGNRCRIENGTRWELVDVRVAGRFSATAERIGAGRSVVVPMNTRNDRRGLRSAAQETFRRTAAGATADALQLTAWIDDVPTPTPLEPLPSQVRRTPLLLAHLEYDEAKRVMDRNLPKGLDP